MFHSVPFFDLCCMYRLDPEAHEGDSPTAVELAAVNGHIETFDALIARLQVAPDNDWFQLAQVCEGDIVLQKSGSGNLDVDVCG